MHQKALSNQNHNVQEQNNQSAPQNKSTLQAKQKTIQAKQRPIQAKQRPIQAKQKPVQARQRPVQRNTAGHTKGGQPQGSAKFKEIATTMGQQHGVDTSQLKATHNSSFPDTVNAEATIQGSKIDFAPGKDTEANIKHEVAHAIDNAKNGTPKGDKVVNGQSVDTTREQTVDQMAAQPLQRKVNQSTENVGQQETITASGPIQRRVIPKTDDKIKRLVEFLEARPNIEVEDRNSGITNYYHQSEEGTNTTRKLFATKMGGKIYFKYTGFGKNVVIDDDSKSTLILGKFGEDWNNPRSGGTRNFVGFQDGNLDIKGAPEGSIAKVEGGNRLYDSNIPGIKVLCITRYNEIINEYIALAFQKALAREGLSSVYKDLGFGDESVANVKQLIIAEYGRYMTDRFINDIVEEGEVIGKFVVWLKYNYPLLKTAFETGDDIRLLSDPQAFRTSFFRNEMDAIEGVGPYRSLAEEYGYDYNEDTKTFVKRRDG
ncbi:hypothetical protein BKI52_24950 [marine bacterium AO1-C]|nr:hypothetical protein BKI52_24950 [marine bacterium AO1-C]